ncbi:MAG: DNA-protecting protein DprA [Ruminococcus sp.]|nr:DNA-protecting protein DprA [Ruminococcus sp.]
MNNKLLLWMWLAEVFGTANPRKWIATSRFDSIEECYDAFTNGDYYGLEYDETIRIQNFNFDNAERIIEYCQKNNINMYCYESEGFPKRLREIYNPPSVIYAKHNSANLDFLDDNVTVAVVGSRKITDYYKKITEEISGQLASAGIVVASGYAVGADTAAHKAAIENVGKTVAVLGSGIDYDYPKGTLSFKDVIAENGAVISEFEPNHAPIGNDFKARNRLLSGISHGVLVTQASPISGSLNTVANAVSQGKDIFCVPPCDVFDENFSGVVNLIRDGAIPVFDARDVIGEYCENFSHKISYSRTMQKYIVKSEDSAIFSEKTITEKPKKPKTVKPLEKPVIKEIKAQIDTDNLSEKAKIIVEVLKNKEMLADDIARETGIGIMELFGELTELEIEGIVKSLPGNRYSL